MTMNPGYMTIFVLMVICILLASGWKDLLLAGISRVAIIVFIMGWLLCSFFSVHFIIYGLGIKINFTFIFLSGYSIFLFSRLKEPLDRIHTFAIAILLGLLDVTLREASIFAIGYDALIMATVTVSFQRRAQKQIASLLLGLLCGNVVSLLIHQRSQTIIMADQRYQDFWWLTLLLTRAVAVIFDYMLPSLKKGWRL
jgi:hypothetical protein